MYLSRLLLQQHFVQHRCRAAALLVRGVDVSMNPLPDNARWKVYFARMA